MKLATLEHLRSVRQAQENEILRSFADLLAIPNSARDPQGLERNITYLEGALTARGLEVEILRIQDAAPVLIATLRAPGAHSTLGIYAHYDGQPVDESRWTDPPWEPTLRSGDVRAGGEKLPFPTFSQEVDPDSRIHARSAADDKGAIAALLAGLDVLAASGISPRSHLTILLEGEEEVGSPHLGQAMQMAKSRLEADAWIVLDGSIHTDGSPLVVLGVRGFAGMEITVHGASRPLHSGTFGNRARNPAIDLSRLLASMKDDSGRVTIDGFYQLFDAPDELTRAAQAALPCPDDEPASRQGNDDSLYLGILQPTLSVRGLSAGGIGDNARNEIPDRASASLDLRLTPGATPAEVFQLIENHLRTQGFRLVDQEPDDELRRSRSKIATLTRQAGYPATRVSPDHPLVHRVASAVELAAGRAPYLVPTVGGSLPLHGFGEVLGKPVLIVPIANPDNGQHGPDENLRLGNLWYGVDLVTTLLTEGDP